MRRSTNSMGNPNLTLKVFEFLFNPLQGHHKYKSHIVAFAEKKKVNVHLKDFQALFNPLRPPRCVERGHIYIQDFHLVSTLHLVVDLSLEENRYIFWYSLM